VLSLRSLRLRAVGLLRRLRWRRVQRCFCCEGLHHPVGYLQATSGFLSRDSTPERGQVTTAPLPSSVLRSRMCRRALLHFDLSTATTGSVAVWGSTPLTSPLTSAPTTVRTESLETAPRVSGTTSHVSTVVRMATTTRYRDLTARRTSPRLHGGGSHRHQHSSRHRDQRQHSSSSQSQHKVTKSGHRR